MRIETLRLRNFRKFADETFRFHPSFTVLIGDNAQGKTSVLDALSIMLGTYVLRFKAKAGRTGILAEEIRIRVEETEEEVNFYQQEPVYIEAHGTLHGQAMSWLRKARDRAGSARELTRQADQDVEKMRTGEDVLLPILVYYGAGRLWDQHYQTSLEAPDSRAVGYRNCLDPKADHKLLEKWFKRKELASLQQGRTFGLLEAVREAVKNCVPGARDIYFNMHHDALMISLEGGGLQPFANLSDGYRNMVAMVADIAHRACRLNPKLSAKAARECPGVVLIDEIDLHLHPRWQRQVVGDLQRTFPNVQFVASSHSPFILQSLDPGEVIDLGQLGKGRATRGESAQPGPTGEYSNRSIEDIAEAVMGVPLPQRSERFQRMYEAAQAYYTVLKQSETADEEEKKRLKAELDRLSMPFSDEPAYHAFLEMERMAAGMGSEQEED